MKINGGNNGPVPPDAARSDRSAVDKPEQQGGTATSRVDSVEISEAGRSKAAESAATARTARLQEVRERILRGAYDADAVVAEVARRILDRGDLAPIAPSETR